MSSTEEDRELIIEHFYLGMTQLDIGKRHGIGQQAVAVRLKKTIGQLRRALSRRGLSVSAALLAVGLNTGLAEAAAPTHLTAALAKIGIAGVGYGRTPVTTRLSIATKVAIAIILIVLCLLTAKWLFVSRTNRAVRGVLAQLDGALNTIHKNQDQ